VALFLVLSDFFDKLLMSDFVLASLFCPEWERKRGERSGKEKRKLELLGLQDLA
jgi:hypothetical protein